MCPAERNDAESIIGRVAAICDACGPGGDVLGISEIARRTGLAKSTVASDGLHGVLSRIYESSSVTGRNFDVDGGATVGWREQLPLLTYPIGRRSNQPDPEFV